MKMKYIFYFLFIFVYQISSAQNAEKTKLFVIGTVHESSAILNPQMLFELLDEIKPDILLQENDSAQISTYFQDIRPNSNEQNASFMYIKKYPTTLNLPFEFEGRNSYRKENGMTPTDKLTIDLIDSLYQNNLLDSYNAGIYKKYMDANQTLIRFSKQDFKSLNSIEFEALNKYRQYIQHHELPKITNSEVIFSKRFVTKPNGDKITYRLGYQLWCNFWDLRNNTMALNIIKTAHKYKGKKIVILTGVQHKYYLKELLEKYDDGNYEVVDYFK